MAFQRIIQVEVTTACQASCSFCPRTALRDDWITRHIGSEDFACMLTAVRRGTLVHLQGWGEPLLHPQLWDMAAAVRRRGGRVSLTTNGMLLDQAACREITRIGFEFVAVTLAGADPALHTRQREGTDFGLINGNIGYLSRLKQRPRLHITTQMLKSNLERLPDLVELAARLGADRLIASNLDCLINTDLDELKAFTDDTDPRSGQIIAAARRRGCELKVEVEVYPLYPQYQVPVCAADPLHTVVVTAAGEIAPCVYLSLPVKGDIPRVFQGKPESTPRFIYGQLSSGLNAVLQGERAHAFRDTFRLRRRAALLGTMGRLALLAMPRLRSREGEFLEPGCLLATPSGTSTLPPAPEPCLHCYKLYGI